MSETSQPPPTNHRANVKRAETEHNEETEYHKSNYLNRIFFYDCKPLTKRVHQPKSGKSLDLAKTPEAKFRLELHEKLRCQRKVALRLGQLDEKNAEWALKANVLKDLLKGTRLWESLKDNDFKYYARQKVVDLKIGLDITLLAEKKLVDQIILISGDRDFLPASKHARREGLDIILDPLWNPIASDLWEHIDGLRSTSPRPR